MQRLFVAVEVPPDVRSDLAARLGRWRDALPGWRWAEPSRWHLTLCFLGDVEPRRLPDLRERLARAGRRHPPLELGLGGLGAFSRPARAQVLWVGVAVGREPLVRLADAVSAAARRARVDLEDRPYRPHLTLGRRQSAVDVRAEVRTGEELASLPWTVRSFTLVESHQGPQVRHETVERFELGRHR